MLAHHRESSARVARRVGAGEHLLALRAQPREDETQLSTVLPNSRHPYAPTPISSLHSRHSSTSPLTTLRDTSAFSASDVPETPLSNSVGPAVDVSWSRPDARTVASCALVVGAGVLRVDCFPIRGTLNN